jgi:hypothetical protein
MRSLIVYDGVGWPGAIEVAWIGTLYLVDKCVGNWTYCLPSKPSQNLLLYIQGVQLLTLRTCIECELASSSANFDGLTAGRLRHKMNSLCIGVIEIF